MKLPRKTNLAAVNGIKLSDSQLLNRGTWESRLSPQARISRNKKGQKPKKRVKSKALNRGAIYTIIENPCWVNPNTEYCNDLTYKRSKIKDLKAANVVYVGKADCPSDADEYDQDGNPCEAFAMGRRFMEHVNQDVGTPWYQIDTADDFLSWQYFPVIEDSYQDLHRYSRQCLEQRWIQDYKDQGADLGNRVNAITCKKYRKNTNRAVCSNLEWEDLNDNITCD